jgi:hypothetical protein
MTNHEKLGTVWCEPGKGAYLDVLLKAAGLPVNAEDELYRTDLALTGLPMQDYDKERIRYCVLIRDKSSSIHISLQTAIQLIGDNYES